MPQTSGLLLCAPVRKGDQVEQVEQSVLDLTEQKMQDILGQKVKGQA